MKCDRAKILIADYLEENLQGSENIEVRDHLKECLVCAGYAKSLTEAWEFLGDTQMVEPEQGYISRFWTELSLRSPWYEELFKSIVNTLKVRQYARVYATVLILVVAGLFSLRNYYQMNDTNQFLANVSIEDMEMVENIELAENMDIINDIEFLEDFDVIEQMETSDFKQT